MIGDGKAVGMGWEIRSKIGKGQETAHASDFTTAAHFVAVYRRRFGQPPGRHRSAPE